MTRPKINARYVRACAAVPMRKITKHEPSIVYSVWVQRSFHLTTWPCDYYDWFSADKSGCQFYDLKTVCRVWGYQFLLVTIGSDLYRIFGTFWHIQYPSGLSNAMGGLMNILISNSSSFTYQWYDIIPSESIGIHTNNNWLLIIRISFELSFGLGEFLNSSTTRTAGHK